MISKKTKLNAITVLLILLCLGFFLKIRNNANTPNVTTVGGIWNIITIIVYIYWFIFVFNKKLKISGLMLVGVSFVLISVVTSIINMKDLSISFIYNLMIVPYFLIILSLFYDIASVVGSRALNMKVFATTFFVLTIFVAYLLVGNRTLDEESFVVADVYYSLNMLPFVFLSKRKALRYSATFATAFALVLSGKRTGFVAFALGLIIFYLISSLCSKSKSEKKKSLLALIITFFTVIVVFVVLSTKFELEFFDRIVIAFTEGESGRQEIWDKIIKDIRRSSVLELLFGHGLQSVPVLIGSKNALAHCDYLEIFYDFGLFAFLLYVSFWILLIIRCLKMIKAKDKYSAVASFSLIISLFLSLFSNFAIDATFITYSMITFGTIFGLQKHEKEKMHE